MIDRANFLPLCQCPEIYSTMSITNYKDKRIVSMCISVYGIDQSSKVKSGTLAKSFQLRVTSIPLTAKTIAAMRKSWVPMRIFCWRKVS